jgi:hypothetical protein
MARPFDSCLAYEDSDDARKRRAAIPALTEAVRQMLKPTLEDAVTRAHVIISKTPTDDSQRAEAGLQLIHRDLQSMSDEHFSKLRHLINTRIAGPDSAYMLSLDSCGQALTERAVENLGARDKDTWPGVVSTVRVVFKVVSVCMSTALCVAPPPPPPTH